MSKEKFIVLTVGLTDISKTSLRIATDKIIGYSAIPEMDRRETPFNSYIFLDGGQGRTNVRETVKHIDKKIKAWFWSDVLVIGIGCLSISTAFIIAIVSKSI